MNRKFGHSKVEKVSYVSTVQFQNEFFVEKNFVKFSKTEIMIAKIF